MQTFIKFIKIIFEISLIMILYYITSTFLPIVYKVSILCWFAAIIIVLLFNYNFLIKLFIKEEQKEKNELFNIYYINHPKVFEICMLINNKRKSKEELNIKDEETQKMTLTMGGNIIKDKNSFSPSILNENSATKTYEYKELQEIKETNSTYLSEIIKKCKKIADAILVLLDEVILEEIVESKSVNSIDDWYLEFTNDLSPNTERYAKKLIAIIPNNKYYELSVMLYKNRDNTPKLKDKIINELVSNLSSEEFKAYCNVIEKDLFGNVLEKEIISILTLFHQMFGKIYQI